MAIAFYGRSESYRKHAYKLLRHFFKVVGKTPETLTPADVDRFIAVKEQSPGGREGSSDRRPFIKLTMSHLQRLYEYMLRVEQDPVNRSRYQMVLEHVKARKREIKLPKNQRRDFLRDNEIDKFMGAIRKEPAVWRLLFTLLLKYGLRIHEALSLRAGNIIYDQRALRYTTKGEKTEYAFIEDDDDWSLLVAVARGKRPEDPLFETRSGRRITYEYARKRFKSLLRGAGLPEDRVKRLRLHDLRRTSAIKVYQETNDIVLTKDWLGHERIETTMIYLDIGKDKYQRKREVAKRIRHVFAHGE